MPFDEVCFSVDLPSKKKTEPERLLRFLEEALRSMPFGWTQAHRLSTSLSGDTQKDQSGDSVEVSALQKAPDALTKVAGTPSAMLEQLTPDSVKDAALRKGQDPPAAVPGTPSATLKTNTPDPVEEPLTPDPVEDALRKVRDVLTALPGIPSALFNLLIPEEDAALRKARDALTAVPGTPPALLKQLTRELLQELRIEGVLIGSDVTVLVSI